ncbi:RHS repeat domain-containing protein [Streptomyces sp. NPDC058377]|uniref:RHS repeat domain-containing protein n=1 Tax=Streptomyces sp. NPDC058377 TaxID=3346468 RepID=UPI0036532ACB
MVNGGTMSYTYDALGRRTSRTTPTGAVSTWAADAAGRRTSLTTSGRTIVFEHDAIGQENRPPHRRYRLLHQPVRPARPPHQLADHRHYGHKHPAPRLHLQRRRQPDHPHRPAQRGPPAQGGVAAQVVHVREYQLRCRQRGPLNSAAEPGR